MSKLFALAYIPLLYGLVCIVLFAVTYRLLDPNKHFEITDEQKDSPWFSSFYISLMAQSNAMGDATPKTLLGRAVFGGNVLAGWIWFLSLSGALNLFIEKVYDSSSFFD